MATLIAYQSGNWTGATTWKQIATGTGSSQTTITSNSTPTSTYAYSSTFTITNGEVIEGVMIYCERLTTAGTVGVALSDNNGVTATREVTINGADLPSAPAWVFFKFATTLTADGGNDYRVGIRTVGSSNGSFYRDSASNNWARILRTSTTATIASTDNVYISDELTGAGAKTDIEVTMNSTSSATTYGFVEVGGGGVLSYGTSASTNYHLKLAGNINVRGDGTFNIGTTGTPIPRTSTAKLEFASASAVQYGLEVRNGGTFNAQGLSRTSGKNVYYCLLNTDEAVNSTSLGVDTDTGWLDNDRIAIAATGSVLAQYEVGTLNGNAGASTLTVDGFGGSGGGLAFAHSGTAPTQAEVALLTRNVEIFGASRTNTAYLFFDTTATVDMDWVYLKWIGSSTTNRLGIDARTTTGSCNIQYCAIEETSTASGSVVFQSLGSTSNNITFSNNVIYDAGQFAILIGPTSQTALEFNNNIIIRVGGTSGIQCGDVGGTINGNRISGLTQTNTIGLRLAEFNATFGTIQNNVIHNCNAVGFGIDGSSAGVVENLSVWHNNIGNAATGGAFISQPATRTLTFLNCDFFGNRVTNFTISASGELIFDNCLFAGTTVLAATSGISLRLPRDSVFFRNCDFGSTTGIYTNHTNDFICADNQTVAKTLLANCLLSATTEVAQSSQLNDWSFIGSARHDQTAGQHRAWKRFGTITTDSTIFKTASPSERLTPNNASGKLESGTKLVAIENATTKTISVWVRKSVTGDGTNYNGNQPRLRYRRSDAAGVTSDGTLDTMTVANGNWEQLTGTSPAITDDAVLEFYVDCDGTAGWVNVDDWTVS